MKVERKLQLSCKMASDGIGSYPVFKREMVDVTVPVGSCTKFLVEIRSPSELNVSILNKNVFCKSKMAKTTILHVQKLSSALLWRKNFLQLN